MTVCNDLRLGGSLDETEGITGGTTINGTALSVDDWSDLFGHVGISYSPVEVAGRPAAFPVGDGLPKARFPMLSMRIRPKAECEASLDPIAVLFERTDHFLALLADSNGQYLEVDHPDGTSRFIKVFALEAAPIIQPRDYRRIRVPLFSPNQFWHEGGMENVAGVNGVDTINVGGTVNVYDPVIHFSGNGTFVHLDQDWSITVFGAGAGTVHVDLGARTVIQGGEHVDQVLRPTNRLWGWFTPGTNNVQSDVATSVSWRDQWN